MTAVPAVAILSALKAAEPLLAFTAAGAVTKAGTLVSVIGTVSEVTIAEPNLGCTVSEKSVLTVTNCGGL